MKYSEFKKELISLVEKYEVDNDCTIHELSLETTLEDISVSGGHIVSRNVTICVK